MDSDRPVAVITGGSRGIGRAVAERLSGDGYQLLLTYRERASEAHEVVSAIREMGGLARTMRADMASPEDIDSIFETVDATYGRLDALVLNAAYIPLGSLTTVSEDDFDKAFAVNTRAAFLAFRAATTRLHTGGRVVAMSTGLTRNPLAEQTAYAASKGALEILVRSFAREAGPKGISVNAVLPGPTATEGLSQAPEVLVQELIQRTPLRRLGEPEDIADVVAFLVSDGARWITGQTIVANGGLDA